MYCYTYDLCFHVVLDGTVKSPVSTTEITIQPLSCSTIPIALAAVVTAITTALLATVIFVLLQIALCKYYPRFKFAPGRAESAALKAGMKLKGEYELERDYEEMDDEKKAYRTGGDPNYAEPILVGRGRKKDESGVAPFAVTSNVAYNAPQN